MDAFKGKSALVVGASSGIGRATVLALAAQGARVWAVARNRERLERIAREAAGEVKAIVGDASDPDVAARALRESDPSMIVVSLGAHARLAPIDEQTWESFSEVWNADLKASFHLGQEALRRPLAPGSRVLFLSSGAAIGGSPLSGGYAGAKRMQWFLAGYLQKRSEARKLGIRFTAVVPKQLVAGTEIAEEAGAAYAALAGISVETFMGRFGAPLTAEGVASALLEILGGKVDAQADALGVTGTGIEAL